DGYRLGKLAPDCVTESTVCTKGGLAKGYQPPTSWRVLRVSDMPGTDTTRRPNKNWVVVDISYELSGETYKDSMQLRRTSGLLSTWTVSVLPGAYLYPVTTHLTTAVLAGAQVKTVAAAPGDSDSVE